MCIYEEKKFDTYAFLAYRHTELVHLLVADREKKNNVREMRTKTTFMVDAKQMGIKPSGSGMRKFCTKQKPLSEPALWVGVCT